MKHRLLRDTGRDRFQPVAWEVVTDRHRCTFPRCVRDAVAVLRPLDPIRGRHRRWFCRAHLARIRREVRSGAVWWQVQPGDYLETLRAPHHRTLELNDP